MTSVSFTRMVVSLVPDCQYRFYRNGGTHLPDYRFKKFRNTYVYSRFRKWIEDGYLDNIFRVLSLRAELQELSLDASIIKAHQHSAGEKKGAKKSDWP